MRDKVSILLVSFVVCLWAFMAAVTPLLAKEWTAEQKVVAERFQKLIDAAVEGDIEKMKSCWHPQISWWNYEQQHPVGIDVYLKEMEDLYKQKVKWISCEAEPLEIHVVDNVAIVYATYNNSFKNAEGKEFSITGFWTAVLIKQEGTWLFLSNSYVEK